MFATFVTNNIFIMNFLENNGIMPLEERKHSNTYQLTHKCAYLIACIAVYGKTTVIYKQPRSC